MPRSMFTSSFGPMRSSSLGQSDAEHMAARAAAKKAAMDKICAITSDWRKAAEGSSDKTAWKRSVQQALTAYANKFYDGDTSHIELRSDIIRELDRCTPRELIPADWIRKWEAIFSQLDRPGPITTRPATATPSRPARPTSMQPRPPASPMRPSVVTPGRMPTAQLVPMPARTSSGTPQYSIDLQRQLDSYSQKLQDFYGTATPTAAVRPATPTAPVSMAPAQPRDPYNLTPRFQAQSNQYNLTPPSMRPATPTYGSVPRPNLPGGLPMDAGAVMSPSALAPAMTTPTSFMGRRVALRRRRPDGAGEVQWWGYQQSFIPELYFARPRVNKAVLSGLPIPEGVCCQATKDGGAICSNGQGFPPTCPNKPTPNVPGVAEYIQQGAYLVPKPPPAAVNGVCRAASPDATKPQTETGAGAAPLVGIAAVGALVYAVVEGLI